jgi:hypothetical protein
MERERGQGLFPFRRMLRSLSASRDARVFVVGCRRIQGDLDPESRARGSME